MERKWSKFIIPCVCALIALAAGIIFNHLRVPDYRDDGILRVCLDAGHGGDDPGAVDPDVNRLEKDDCLAMILAVRDRLAASYPEIEIILTRSDDTFIELADRCNIANKSRADLFISVHRNSAQSSASGVEIWVPSGGPRADKQLAEGILHGLVSAGINEDRGIRSGTSGNPTSDYYVNRHTKMPSCLIELGFMTSDADNKLFDSNFDAYAQAIANGIAAALITE
ncbi:MAG: N-acetylmuramoyl-L-alanine amidase [Clostridia bacterium]|nr:N-acetylmuramoyl-L-alanine amidase [Clostridia bacterium]